MIIIVDGSKRVKFSNTALLHKRRGGGGGGGTGEDNYKYKICWFDDSFESKTKSGEGTWPTFLNFDSSQTHWSKSSDATQQYSSIAHNT